jgi:hypothetical protein
MSMVAYVYLGDAMRADETGVTIDLSRLKKIPDPRAEIGDPNTPFDPEEEQGDAPPEIELGRLLAISRFLGVLDPRVAYGIQLLLASAQRRRTVIHIRFLPGKPQGIKIQMRQVGDQPSGPVRTFLLGRSVG